MSERSPTSRDSFRKSAHQNGRASTPVTARPPKGFKSQVAVRKETSVGPVVERASDDLDERLNQLKKTEKKLVSLGEDDSEEEVDSGEIDTEDGDE